MEMLGLLINPARSHESLLGAGRRVLLEYGSQAESQVPRLLHVSYTALVLDFPWNNPARRKQ